MSHPSDVLIGLHAAIDGVSAAAFDPGGRELGLATVPLAVVRVEGAGVEQDMAEAWQVAARALHRLADRVPDLARRTVALALTGEGDGTWLIDEDGDPVAPAWLWPDGRAAGIAAAWRAGEAGQRAQAITGGVPTASSQSAQLAWLLRHRPAILEDAASVLDAKGWLYCCCTGERATDPAGAACTYGGSAQSGFDERVLGFLGLAEIARLLPPPLDGLGHQGALTAAASAATGLHEGTPVVLAPDEAMATALAAGLGTGTPTLGCSSLGPRGVHMRPLPAGARAAAPTPPAGWTLPLAGTAHRLQGVAHAATLANVDWLIGLADQLMADAGLIGISGRDLRGMLEARAAEARPATLLFHPFIRHCGELGPFVEPEARAQLTGIATDTTLYDLLRAIHEGIAFAARDCYEALGGPPAEVRLARAGDGPLPHRVLAACLGVPLRPLRRAEPAAAGAALFAALAMRLYRDPADADAAWVEPHLAEAEPVDEGLRDVYRPLFDVYRQGYRRMGEVWRGLAEARARHAGP